MSLLFIITFCKLFNVHSMKGYKMVSVARNMESNQERKNQGKYLYITLRLISD